MVLRAGGVQDEEERESYEGGRGDDTLSIRYKKCESHAFLCATQRDKPC